MTRYLMSVIGPSDYTGFGTYATEEEMREAMAATRAFTDRIREDGALVFVGGLEAPATATVVDGLGDEPLFTDGPYAESKEGLNGLWVVDVPDLDAALKLASEASHVCRGRIEVRPFAAE
ncbi:YciI family protein [Microbacterium karelineae]|uniref:YciI family protein n=1 Tax=Microbacterium karelineae TaxID=2654283 RepID=UPI0012EA432A|nr:YciI family protein [Microbacterium karelineae]